MLLNSEYQPQKTVWLSKPGFTLSGTVNDPNAVAKENGQKYMLAGTMLTASSAFTLHQEAVLTPTTDPTQAQGVLVEDTNITNGACLASVAVGGTLNRHWLYDEVKANYTDANITKLQQSLPRLIVADRV